MTALSFSRAVENSFEDGVNFFRRLSLFHGLIGMDQGAFVFGMGCIVGDGVNIFGVEIHDFLENFMDFVRRFSRLLSGFHMPHGTFITGLAMGMGILNSG